MFLSDLNANEQELFLELAYYVMGLNQEHKNAEIDVFDSYTHECHKPGYEPSRQSQIDFVIKELSKTKLSNKRIIMIELFGIMLSDDEFCANEANFVDKLTEKFEMKAYMVKRIKRWVEGFNDMVQEGYELISRK
jgi:hypothetical protein